MRFAPLAVAGLVLSVGVSGALAPDVLGIPEAVAPAAATSAAAVPEPDVSAGSEEAKNPLALLDEVVSARTETSRTWATESPGVMKTEISTGPVNYRGPDGKWLPIDTSLVTALSGALLAEKNSFATRLAPLASGSSMVKLSLDGGLSLEYGLKGAVPAPVVPDLSDTSVATYKKALPGVDVRLRVLGTGVKEELVLAGPNTATQFTFPLALNGLTAREVAEGIEFVDDAGELVARMPHGWMQDSARPQGAGEGAISDGAKLSLVAVNGNPAIRMTLDTEWLSAPERVFPVVVDPTTTIVTNADDTFVQKSYNMDFSGHEDLKAGTWDNGATPSRSFMHFPLGSITGNDVQSADLRLYSNWSYSCNARQLNVRRVLSSWSGSSARWAGPSIGSWNIASPSFAYGYHSSCAAREVAMDVTPAVENWASGNWTNHGLALVASETDNYAWKRFNSYNAGSNRPRLVVTWADSTPSSITSTSSSTHPNMGIWYSKDDITVSWTASDTGGSGLDGYSYVLDQNSSTVPNTTKNVNHPTTTASFANRADGIWWFHVRARDNAGNWGDPKHRRIRVDTTGPTEVGGIRSTSGHLPLLVSFDREITIEWDPATDAHAGVAGYSVVFNSDKDQPANAKVNSSDTGPYTSRVLDDGVYWAHVRAIDAAEHPDSTYDGNPGPDKTYGPFLIGTGALTDLLLPDPVAQSNELGLEQFSPYASADTGAGSAYTQLRTGNLVTQQDLATVPGQGLNAVLRLTHNAHAAKRERGFGKGWTLSVADVEGAIEGALEGLSDGSVTDMDVTSDVVLGQTTLIDGVETLTQDLHYALDEATGNALEFTDGDGTVHRFIRTGEQGSRWDAPPGVDLQLREVEKEIVDAAGATVKVVDYFELTRPDGVVYKVTRQDQALGLPLPLWRVSEITDRNGNKLAFTHANQGPAGINQSRLTEIHMTRVGASAAGELVAKFTYSTGTLLEPARLTTVETLPGHATLARTTGLAYDADGRLVTVEENPQRPSGAADRRKVLYTYNTDHTIATVSEGLPDSAASATAAQKTTFGYVTNKIDASDRKALPRVTSMLDRAGKTWTWNYGTKAGTTTGERETVATRPFSGTTTRSTTYTFSGRGTVDSNQDTRIAGGNVTAIQDPGTDAGPVTNRYEWYANKLVASVDGLGNRTEFTYNGLGLLTTVTSPPPNRPGHEGLPAGAVTDPVTSTLAYEFPAGSAPTTCEAPGYGSGRPVTADGLCDGAVGELTKVTVADSVDAQQRIADFSYDARGNLTQMVERANADGSANNTGDRTSRFAYYANGALAKIDGPRTDVTDVTCYAWAATNTTDCDTSDAPVDGGYHATGLPPVVKDALGKKRTFTYDRYGMKTKVVDRDGAVTSSVYNALNDMVSATVPGAKTTTYAYDRNGNKTSETSAGNKTTTWSYDALDRLGSVTSPGSITTSYGYYDDGSADFIDGPLTGTADRTTYAYFPNGSVKTITAPAATGKTAVTDHAYDAAGQLIRTTQPVANAAGNRPVIALTLTPSGDVQVNATTASTGAAGNTDRKVTTYYNAHSEPITQTGPRTVGNVLQRTDTTYDSFGQAVEVARTVTGSKQLLYKTGYDLAGNQISSTQPTGNGAALESKYKFDALNRLAEQHVDPVNVDHRVSYEYTGEGQQSRRIDWKQDPLGNANTPCSNVLALCTKQRQVDTTFNPDNSQASMVYTDHSPNATAPLTKATCNYAAGQASESGYDVDGNLLITRTMVSQGVDVANVCSTGTLWREQTFSYNTRGLISGTVQKVRSPGTGNLVSRTQSFTYHADGTRASFTHGDGTTSNTTTYEASPAGWNESVTDWRGKTSTTSYLANGGVDAVSLGGGRATAALGYHNDGSMADFTWKATPGTDPAVVVRAHTGIGYDIGGLRTGETVKVRNPGASELTGAAASYSHDVLDRLVGFTSPFAYKTGPGSTGADAGQPVVKYNLDDGGNITAEITTVGAVERRRVTNSYGNGRLTQAVERTVDGLNIGQTTTKFTYTALGEEKQRKLTTNLPLGSNVTSQTDSAYDPAGHTKASDNTANLGNGAPAEDVEKANTDVTYRYDTGDRVLVRTETKPDKPAEHTLLFYMGGTGSLAEETDAQGDTKIRYLLDADGEALAQQTYKVTNGDADGTGMKWTWLLNDAVGNTATLIGDDGAVIEQKAFDPYGADLQGGSKRTETTDAPKTTLGFQGARTDEATGRVMLGPRQYDPSSGRFTSPDFFVAGALDLQLGTDALTGNRYLFAGAMPTTFYEDGHGFGSFLKKTVKKVAPVLEYVPVVSTAVDVVNAATGKNWYEGGRPMSGAERMMALGGAALGLVPGGNAAKAGAKAATKGLDKANSARKVRKAEACPIGNSFTLDTQVLMANGTAMPIGKIQVGDLVWASDPFTGEQGPRAVTALIDGAGAKTLVEITTDDGQLIVATDAHPVFLPRKNRYIDAVDLEAGDRLLDADGDQVGVLRVDVERVAFRRVRNLTVAGLHTYHVGRPNAAFLVHNQNRNCGETAHTKLGREAHLAFESHLEKMDGYGGPVSLGRRRTDGRKLKEDGLQVPVELKPAGSRLRRGELQLHGYEREMKVPKGSGELWTYTARTVPIGPTYFQFQRVTAYCRCRRAI